MFSLIWGNFHVCPECVATNDTPVVETNDVSTGAIALGEESICKFAEGYDSQGKVVPSGTKVTGPAVVKPFRDEDHALVLNVGVEYITTNSDEVVWLLIGDNACALSNAEPFYSTYEIKTNP